MSLVSSYLGGVAEEIGTFTPTFVPTSGTMTLGSSNTWHYVKIGSIVHIGGEIWLSNNSATSLDMDIGNLPFANISNLANLADQVKFSMTFDDANVYKTAQGFIGQGASFVSGVELDNGANLSTLANTARARLSFTYTTG